MLSENELCFIILSSVIIYGDCKKEEGPANGSWVNEAPMNYPPLMD